MKVHIIDLLHQNWGQSRASEGSKISNEGKASSEAIEDGTSS